MKLHKLDKRVYNLLNCLTLQKNDKRNYRLNQLNAESLYTLTERIAEGKKSQELNNTFTKINFISYGGREKEEMAHVFLLFWSSETLSNKAGIYQLGFLEVSENNTAHVFTGKCN